MQADNQLFKGKLLVQKNRLQLSFIDHLDGVIRLDPFAITFTCFGVIFRQILDRDRIDQCLDWNFQSGRFFILIGIGADGFLLCLALANAGFLPGVQ